MYIPKNIILTNFLSHKFTSYDYKDGFRVIQGVNLDVDDNNEESNGSGKSSLLEAELFCLTSLSARDIVSADLIKDGEDFASVEFLLYETKLKHYLKIKRNIFLKKSSILEISFIKDDVEKLEEFATITDGNNLILKILGISQSDLINFYLISKEKYKSFYKSSDSNKKEIISRFSGSDLLENIETIIEEDLKEPNNKLKSLQEELLKIQGSIETYIEDLNNLDEKAFNEQKNKDILYIEEQIKGHQIEIKLIEGEKNKIFLLKEQQEKELKQTQQILKQKQQEIENFSLLAPKEEDLIFINEKKQQIDKKISIIQDEINESNKSIKETKIFIAESEAKIAGEINCPHCKKSFILGNENINIEEIKKTIEEANLEIILPLEKEIKEKEQKIERINLEYFEINEEKKKYNEKVKQYEENLRIKTKEKTLILNEISSIENSITTNINNLSLKDKLIKSYDTNIYSLQEQIETLKKSNLIAKKEELELKINNKKKEKENIDKQLQILNEEIFEKSKWISIFLNFKSWLANKAIKNIEGQTNFILSEMNSELQVKIEGMTLLSDGKTIRDKISTSILRNGLPAGLLGKFSGGEKGKIEIATILAFQKMLNMSCSNGGLDLMTVDEILESISRRGMTKLINSLQTLNSNIKLITHVYLDKDFPNITETIVKSKGISQFL
jgi:chromosome segregation ATPase